MTLLFIIKFFIGKAVALKNPVTINSFLMMFINPMDKGFVVHLWFIYALFLVFLVYPVLEKVLGFCNIYVRGIIYFLISLIPMTHLFCLNLVVHYLVYFHLGGIIVRLGLIKPKHSIFCLSVSLALFMIMGYACNTVTVEFVKSFVSLMMACLGIFFSYFLTITCFEKSKVLAVFLSTLGVYSFQIYLFHTLGSEIMALILRRIIVSNIIFYPVNIIVSTAFGLLIPIILTKTYVQFMPSKTHCLVGVKN